MRLEGMSTGTFSWNPLVGSKTRNLGGMLGRNTRPTQDSWRVTQREHGAKTLEIRATLPTCRGHLGTEQSHYHLQLF
jgi:hypothetical protein